MTQLVGAPKVVLSVQDKSIIKDTPIGGIVVVQGITKRGVAARPVFCGNELQFIRRLGNIFTDGSENFPLYCLRMLQGGVKLWVVPAHHYTDIDDPATVDGTKATYQNGVALNGALFTAEEVGDGYNGTSIVVTDAASGTANKYDIAITLNESDETITVYDVSKVPDAAEIAALNLKLAGLFAGVVLTSVAGTGIVADAAGALSSGARTIGDVVAADYNGSVTASNGWYALDGITDAFRVAQLGIESPVVDAALAAYVTARADMRFHIPTPLGISATGFGAYRDGSSPYSHSALDTFYGSLVAADINITDPKDTDKKHDIPSLVDVMVLQARKDVKFGPWWSAAGGKRGKVVGPNNGISTSSVNMGAGSQGATFDSIYNKGVNAVIEDDQFGPVYWGNRSLKIDRTSLLNRENVADLVVYITRAIRPIARQMMFDPTLPPTWKEFYRRVRPLIETLESNSGIVPGEDENWFWQGDQDADVRTDAKFNTQGDLDAGKYKVRFIFIPVTATEFIGIDVTVTDSNSVKFVVQENVTI